MNLLNMNRPEKPVRAALAVLLLWCSLSVHAEQYTVPLFVSASVGGGPQGVLRLVNGADADAAVSIRAIDDAGHRTDAAMLTLGAGAAVQLSAAELQSGNAAKGLPAGLGTLAGDVRLAIDSDLPVVPSAYVRGADGALAEMNATVLGAADASRFPGAGQTAYAGEDGRRYDIALFHPAGNAAQPSRLRLVNPNDAEARVTIGARDDAGNPAPGGSVQLTLPAGGARTLTARQLEAGDGASLTGRLGAGVGNWRLSVSSDRPIQALNVTLDASGGWRNLSTTAVDGWAPADAAAFEARFLDRALVLRNGEAPGGFHVRAESRFADLDAPDDIAHYVYERAGRDTGRVQLQSAECGVNLRIDLYFAAAGEGWYNSACADGLEPGEYRGGGLWMALPPQAVPLDMGGELADRVLVAGAPIAAIALPEAAGGPGGAGGLSYTLSPEVLGLSFDPATRRLAGTPSEAGDYVMTYTVRAASGDRDWRRFRLAVSGGAGGRSTGTFGAGDTLSGLPADGWRPDGLANGTFRVEGGDAAVELAHRGHFESGGQRYTCLSVDGCVIRNREIASGSILRAALGDGDGTRADTLPSFANATGPGDQTYTADTAIAALVLPAASGGDGALIYTLTPSIPGLTFDAAARRLRGTPRTVGSYDMTYTATDADGDSDSIRFTVTVEAVANNDEFAERFTLADGETVSPEGITFANGRFHIVDGIRDKVYAYTASGARDPVADFELDDDNDFPTGIAFANGRFYVVEGIGFRDKVYAYAASGARDPVTDFELDDDNGRPVGIAFANGRFHIVDESDDKVYAYAASGARDPVADFELDGDNGRPVGIAFANGRLHILNSSINDSIFSYDILSSEYPELAASATVSDRSLDAGERFTLNAVVRNLGTLSAAPTTLRYYLSTDSEFSTSDAEVATAGIEGLASGAITREPLGLTAPSTGGCYFCGVCVDAVDGEGTAANNCSDSIAIAVGEQPDLAISSFVVDAPASANIFTEIKATVRVTNHGGITSPPSQLHFSGGRSFAVDVPPLAPGERDTFNVTVGTASLGSTTYEACIDFPCDENTDNNCGDDTVFYGIGTATNGPMRMELDK